MIRASRGLIVYQQNDTPCSQWTLGPRKGAGDPVGSPAPSPCVWRAAPRTPASLPIPVTAASAASTTRLARLSGPFRQATAESAIHTLVPRKQHLSRFDPLNRPPRSRRQTACKPGSVPPRASPLEDGDGHSSGAPVAGRLVRPTRAAARRPARRTRSLGCACRSYLVLLPVGFSLPPPLPAARCALTAPFHPCRPARHAGDRKAVYFLWHFPWGRPRRGLPGTAPPWSPDFPLPG